MVWFHRRLPGFPFWLAAAIVWTALEYYRSVPFVLNYGWMGLGYAFVNDHLFARMATLFGSFGLSFVLAALAGLIAQSASNTKLRLPSAAGYAALILVNLVRLPPHPVANPLKVRLVQAEPEEDERHFHLSQPTTGFTPDIIVWPEYSFVSDPMKQSRLSKPLRELARNTGSYLLFGAEDVFDNSSRAGYRNTAFLLDPMGNLVGTHVKNHTVHFFQDGVAGTDANVFATPIGRLGVGICFDMDYPDVARRLVENGAEVFLVPNDDPPDWGRVQRIQHRMMFQMRALECGRWLARADVAGGTSVATADGVEAAHVNTGWAVKLDAVISREQGRTVFVRAGWMFGPLCMWSAVAMWLWAIFMQRKLTKSG
jgi:apolipoprotein N-acyltransferase